MTKFRPCIDLHEGRVKQIVGGTLGKEEGTSPTENFVSDRDASWFGELYREHNVPGGHVIMLGPGNEDAARSALRAWPRGLQIGGGIRPENATAWLDSGASHIIATSWLFDEDGRFSRKNLEALLAEVGPEKLVLDLSCRRETSDGTPRWTVAMNKWQTRTDLEVTVETLRDLSTSCAEFLVHAADVEGLQQGIDPDLVEMLGEFQERPVTYAGGASSLEDLTTVEKLSGGHVDLTIGSALDIFGGSGVRFEDCVAFNRR
ncbi:MAG: phosphoribosylformimino-5-aminoimidazole carboxamide ribotide isomerase [Verrucomicrobiota bacterium]